MFSSELLSQDQQACALQHLLVRMKTRARKLKIAALNLMGGIGI